MRRLNIMANIAAEIENWISSAKALSRNIEEIHMVVLLGSNQYELVPAPESLGTALHISALQRIRSELVHCLVFKKRIWQKKQYMSENPIICH